MLVLIIILLIWFMPIWALCQSSTTPRVKGPDDWENLSKGQKTQHILMMLTSVAVMGWLLYERFGK